MAFSYKSIFRDALAALRREGRYRVFADILRERGAFPKAGLHAPGATYTVSGIYERDRQLLQFLEARGIRPKEKLRLLERNYDKTLSIRTAGGKVILGRPAAERIWVSASTPQNDFAQLK